LQTKKEVRDTIRADVARCDVEWLVEKRTASSVLPPRGSDDGRPISSWPRGATWSEDPGAVDRLSET
jgi:hypothetical protein